MNKEYEYKCINKFIHKFGLVTSSFYINEIVYVTVIGKNRCSIWSGEGGNSWTINTSLKNLNANFKPTIRSKINYLLFN